MTYEIITPMENARSFKGSGVRRCVAAAAWPRYAAQLLKHVARLGLVYIKLHVSRKKEPPLFELLGRLRNFLHVVVVIFVTLFERKPRIAGS